MKNLILINIPNEDAWDCINSTEKILGAQKAFPAYALRGKAEILRPDFDMIDYYLLTEVKS